MEFLADFNPLVVGLIVAGLCIVGVVLVVLLQVLGTVFGAVFNVFEIIGGVLQGGPVAWCSCLLGLLGCGGCALFIALTTSWLGTCGTPDAANFCRLFGL